MESHIVTMPPLSSPTTDVATASQRSKLYLFKEGKKLQQRLSEKSGREDREVVWHLQADINPWNLLGN